MDYLTQLYYEGNMSKSKLLYYATHGIHSSLSSHRDSSHSSHSSRHSSRRSSSHRRSRTPPPTATSSKVTLEILREREGKKTEKDKEKTKTDKKASKDASSVSRSGSSASEDSDNPAKKSRLDGEFGEKEAAIPSVEIDVKGKGKAKEVVDNKEVASPMKMGGNVYGDYIVGEDDDADLQLAIMMSMEGSQDTNIMSEADLAAMMAAANEKSEMLNFPDLPDFDDVEDTIAEVEKTVRIRYSCVSFDIVLLIIYSFGYISSAGTRNTAICSKI